MNPSARFSSDLQMGPSLAAAITRAASTQTFFTIRLLVDGPRKQDAYRAYAYFRWVDDVLDASSRSGSTLSDADRLERMRFLDRQKSLLERCLRGDAEMRKSGGSGMALDDPNGVSVEPGQTEMLEITFDEAGELKVGCHEPGHFQAGMAAPINVHP